jgi:hypothetical protein
MRTATAALVGIVLALGTVGAARATVTITNCAGSPAIQVVNKKTVVDVPGDTVVIQCALVPLPGSDQTQVTAAAITVDGPGGGSVGSTGKGTQATLLQAIGGDVLINDADVVADNSNGGVVIDAAGAITVTAGSTIRSGPPGPGGDRVTMTAGSTINVAGAVIEGREIVITANGTVTISPTSTLVTDGPRDRIEITSRGGDVIVAGGGQSGSTAPCCADLVKACQDPNSPDCPFRPGGPGMVKLNSIDELNAFCMCPNQPPSRIVTGPEGDILISAPLGKIDVSGTTITAGANIRLTAANDVDMEGATISNCGPKRGVVVVTGATCNVEGASILDDDPELLPTLACTQSGTPVVLGTCSSSHL